MGRSRRGLAGTGAIIWIDANRQGVNRNYSQNPLETLQQIRQPSALLTGLDEMPLTADEHAVSTGPASANAGFTGHGRRRRDRWL